MRKVTVAAVQMSCTRDVQENISNAEQKVRACAEQGANIILLPELFERQYFCQERRYDYYHFAKPVNENDAVIRFSQVAKELGVVIPVSFYEKDGNRLFNSVAVIDADGSISRGVSKDPHSRRPLLSGEILFHSGGYWFQNVENKIRLYRCGHLLGPMVSGNGKGFRPEWG